MTGAGWGTGACAGVVVCPVCGLPLSDRIPRSVRCPRGHAYDVAREGYVNLLASGHGRTRRSGDARVQLRARQRFLDRGHYHPLADRIAALARALIHGRGGGDTGGPAVVLDAGCGTGHYTGRVAGILEGGRASCVLGFDASKEAVRLAARSHPRVRFFVNDVAERICVADGRVDLLMNVFAPRNPAEFARAVRPGGALLVVIPSPHHLAELREALPLLDVHPGKEERALDRLAPAFRLVDRQALENRIALGPGDAADLLRMTPAWWHLDEDADERAERAGLVEATAAFTLLSFRRSGATP